MMEEASELVGHPVPKGLGAWPGLLTWWGYQLRTAADASATLSYRSLLPAWAGVPVRGAT